MSRRLRHPSVGEAAVRTCAMLIALAAASAQRSFAQPEATTTASAGGRNLKPTTPADWGKWESLGSGALSPDGKWVAYDFRRNAGGTELRYRTVAGGPEKAVPWASTPVFTSDNRYLLYTMVPDTTSRGGRGAGASAAGGRGNSVSARNKVAIVNLATGATAVREDVQSFQLNKGGTLAALRRYPTAGRRGADLVIHDFARGSDITLGNVAEYSWNDEGSSLAMTIDVDGKTGNGVQVFRANNGGMQSLDAADQQYVNLQWRPRSNDLTAFRSRSDSMFVDTSFTVIVWRDAGSDAPAKQVYDFSADNTFPANMRVVSYRRPQWSDDGRTLFFGIAPREPKVLAARGGGQAPARVEVWHWKDLRQYHQQDRQSAQDRTRNSLVAWQPGQKNVVRLADDVIENIVLSDNRAVAIGSDEAPYFKEVISGRPYRDVYKVDLATGRRDKIIAKAPFNASMSPDGHFMLYAQGGQWWALNSSTGKASNLTVGIKSLFMNMEDDHPVADRRPYGLAGFASDMESVLLYDRFDVWRVKLDGTGATRVTNGARDSTVYRIQRDGGGGGRGGQVTTRDPADRYIDLNKPLTLSADGEFNKKSGYARVTVGQPVQRLMWLDKSVSVLTKAQNADVYLLQQESYETSPNFYVSSGDFQSPQQISHTNAFQKDFAWSKQELLPYTNSRGDKLQMMLTYPADYVPGKKYPMVVYYYEKLSQGFHQYIPPSDKATYNTTVFAQNGYFVLRPDIVFRPRDPGMSGLDCVTAAVKTALTKVPDIDKAKVGNMGHSWGGYQSAFYAVNSKLFAATIAGAPLTDLISFYGYTSFNTGSPETGHFETGQERMQVSLWEDPQAYIRNSTVFAVDKLQTPLLLEEGDADGNVNYWQSTELYNFGRRLGKNVVYLIYNDENHGVARPESQMDYHTRQLQWFAHYLKGEPAADWIANGESYLTRQRLLKEAGATATPRGPGT